MKGIITILLFAVLCLGYSNPVSARQPEVTACSQQTTKDTTTIEITVVDNRIKVINAPIGSKLEIYSVVGIKVKEIEIKESSGEYMVNIAKGYYIIRIADVVRKVAIR